MFVYVSLGILKKHWYFQDTLFMFGEDYEKEN